MKRVLTIFTLFALSFSANAQWTHVYNNSDLALKSIFFKDALNGYSCGVDTAAHESVILHSSDGGATWNTLHQAVGYQAYSIVAIGDTISCFVTDSLNQPHKIVSYDNGEDWHTAADAAYRYGVSVHNHAIYHVAHGQLIRDNDGTAIPLLDSVAIFSINSTGITTFSWELSMPMRVKHSSDFGTSWTDIASIVPYLLFSGSQSSRSSIAKFGDTVIIKYTYPAGVNLSYDNGATWQEHTAGEGATPFPSFFTKIVNRKTMYSSNMAGTWPNIYWKIVKSETSGTSWHLQDSIAGEVTQFHFFNENEGFACTEKGEILKTTNGGGTTSIVASSLKGKVSLYPNPATGKISLEYDSEIRVSGIRLLDITGRTVKTFIPGERTLNISGITTGNYLLQLITDKGNWTQELIIKQ